MCEEVKTSSDKEKENKKIHYQQTYTIRNAKKILQTEEE